MDHCIWSSMLENAAFNFSAFLISSALTYGYSPYSRKLGHWCSRTNLMNAGAFVFQSSGKPSRFSKTVLMPSLREESHGILGVFVEVGVEDALIHEVGFPLDVEKHPAQVVELEHSETVRLARHRLSRCSWRTRKRPALVPGLIFAMIVKP